MKTEKRWTSHQAYVDQTVYGCLQKGIRTRKAIIRAIQFGRLDQRNYNVIAGLTGLEEMNVTHAALMIAVSRSTSRKDKTGHRDIWCVPGKLRYVSLARLRDLTEAHDSGNITAEDYAEWQQSKQDVFDVAEDQMDKGRRMLRSGFTLRRCAIEAHHPALAFEAATTHTGG